MLAAASLPGWPAAEAATTPTVTLLGSGYGHGVGLSQYGARGMALEGRTAPEILTHYYTGTTVAPVDDSMDLRVNLLHLVTSATFRSVAVDTCGGAMQVAIGGVGTVASSPADSWRATKTPAGIVLSRTSTAGTTTYPATTAVTVRWAGTRFLPGPATLLDLAGPGEALGDNTGRYRDGDVGIVAGTSTMEVVAVLRLHDEYLDGIAEMSSAWPTEAVRTQIVASRTYALNAYGSGAVTTSCSCHLYDSVYSQVYAGWSKQSEAGGLGARWTSAVTSTAATSTTGLAVLYGGAPIAAYFASSTGGQTRASENVWGGVLPYARSVDDHWSLQKTNNPMASWQVPVTTDRLRASVFPALPDIARFQLTSFNADGTLATATAWSAAGTSATATGAQVASGLGLLSRWVTSFTTTLANSPSPVVDVKVTPGYRLAGTREWLTWCEPYGVDRRCWSYLKATTVVGSPGSYRVVYDWVFNNITYLAASTPAWDTNPLAQPGERTISGRLWNVTCTPGATGPRTCRAWIWATLVSAQPQPGGGYVFVRINGWVYNDEVRISGV